MSPNIATLGRLLGDTSRAAMLTALMSGKALTATELASEADISAQTATSHLNQLVEHRFLVVRKQGRHKYFQLANYQVAELLENLLTMSAQLSIPTIHTGPTDPALKHSRVCYDHLAGELGVQLYDALKAKSLIIDLGEETQLTDAGRAFFTAQGFDFNAPRPTKRLLCKSCLDWSERTNHLSGVLGKWILDDQLQKNGVRPALDSRALVFSSAGLRAFKHQYGL